MAKGDTEETGYRIKSVRMADWLWEIVEKDARRCFRSATGQIEAILTVLYSDANVELLKLDDVRNRMGIERLLVPVTKPIGERVPIKQEETGKKRGKK